MRRYFLKARARARRPLRFAPTAGAFSRLDGQRVQFVFGLQPMRRLLAVRLTGLLPNLVRPPGDVIVSD